jgi:hypothetical protein
MHKYAISGGITWIMEQTGELTCKYTQIWDLYGIYMGFMIQNRDLPVNIQQKGQTMGNFPVRKMI